MRKTSDDTLFKTFTGGGIKNTNSASLLGQSVYFVRKVGATFVKTSADIQLNTFNSTIVVDLASQLSLTVSGLLIGDTFEIRKASDNSIIYTGNANGTYAQDPANIGVSVYGVKKNGANIIASTITTPITLLIGENSINLYSGNQIQTANDTLAIINTINSEVKKDLLVDKSGFIIKL